jgi:RND superfamily putative drug exporter
MTLGDAAVQAKVAAVERTLKADPRVSRVVPPQAGLSISRDGHTAIVQAGAGADANTMVRAADDLKAKLHKLQGDGVQVSLTGASGMWSGFNHANKTAMMKSELISWPVTLVILVLAFGSLVAAGLPLMLTILGLMASAGSLYLVTQPLDVSIWAMNFALMFALALGIDYALVAVFFTFALSGPLPPKEMGVILGVAVLLDAMLVRLLLVPVLLRLMGRWAWWLPKPLDRILPDVRFGHAP